VTSFSFDLIWIEYELFPWLPDFGEWLLAVCKKPYVVDYDDAVYHRYDSSHSSVVRLALGSKIDRIMKRASTVIVGNPYIGDHARKVGAKRVEYLPTVVDLTRYQLRARKRTGPFTVGWIGSPSTAAHLQGIGPVLAEFCRSHGARLIVIGARNVAIQGVLVEVRPWSEEREIQDLHDFDIGIMPLPDEPWERGKSGYKLVQYMACSLPVIASPVGVNVEIVRNGVNGYLATTHTEWRKALETLQSSEGQRMEMGTAGRRLVEKRYSVQVTAPQLASILRDALVHY
jgi:glycosyltransferase involved in cell wall biosynthesis